MQLEEYDSASTPSSAAPLLHHWLSASLDDAEWHADAGSAPDADSVASSSTVGARSPLHPMPFHFAKRRKIAEVHPFVEHRAEPQPTRGGSVCGDSWLQVAGRLAERLRLKEQAFADELRLVSRFAFSVDPMRGSYRNGGDYCMERIQRDLDLFGVVRSSVQKLFHYWFLQAILEKVYRDEWDSSATRVLQQYGLKETWSEVMAMTPRRFGKTWSVAMFVVAVVLNVPGIKIAIFSTGKRASNSLMDIAKSFVHKIEGAQNRICKQSTEELYISLKPLPPGRGSTSLEARRMQSDSTTSTVHSYPSSVKGEPRECVCACACGSQEGKEPSALDARCVERVLLRMLGLVACAGWTSARVQLLQQLEILLSLLRAVQAQAGVAAGVHGGCQKAAQQHGQVDGFGGHAVRGATPLHGLGAGLQLAHGRDGEGER